MKRKLPRSIRKHIRKEKARIRREFLDFKKQKEEIEKLYQKIFEQKLIHKTKNLTRKIKSA
jgi:hypothetical protein